MSSDFAQVLDQKKQLLTTGKTQENKTTVNNCKGYKCTPQQVDYLVDRAAGQGLIASHMRAWHCRAAFILGSEIYERCASQAKADGKVPAKLFTYLLNLELKKAPPEAGKVTNT